MTLAVRVLSRVAYAVTLPAILFAAWWIASDDSEDFYQPPLRVIMATFDDAWTAAEVREHVLPSVVRLGAGYGLALLTGIALGVLIGTSPRVRATVEPVFEFFRAIPPPVLVPIIMLFAGIEDTMKVIVIATGAFWPILLNSVEGVRAVDGVLADTARSYRITGPAKLRHLLLRSASPQIVTGARQGLAIGMILMVISEMYAANNGLGYRIVQAQRTFDIPEMWTGIILLGLLGFALSVLFRLAENRVLAWYHGLRAAQRRP